MSLDLNRQSSFMRELLVALMTDCSDLNTFEGYNMDVAEIITRCDCEGLPFVTLTLPTLGKAVEAGLETGQLVVPDGFRPSKRNPGLPALFQDLLRHVFDQNGLLLERLSWVDTIAESNDEASSAVVSKAAAAVRLVRQLCYCGYKLEVPRDQARDEQLMHDWVTADQELKHPDDPDDPPLVEIVRHEFSRLFNEVDLREIRPRHGPGAVATGERGDQKWAFQRHYDHFASVYDLSYFTVGGADELADRPEWVESMSSTRASQNEAHAKMVVVHKDGRGGRTIAEEILELQYLQQGVADAIRPWIERRSAYGVRFFDQSMNRKLAVESSVDRQYATIDLKNASDRVSLWAVRKAAGEGDLLRVLEATRSRTVIFKTRGKQRVHVSRVFAPMGSALCFPVEAALFWSIAVAAISARLPGRRQWIREHVHVYGDDIIVPREYAACVMDALESWGLTVNRTKSFVHGFFRESCGADAFAGADVTPIRLKKLLPSSRSSASELASYAAVAARLAKGGFRRASELAYSVVEEILGDLPAGLETSGYICRVVECPTKALLHNLRMQAARRLRVRENRDWQRVEFHVWKPVNPTTTTELDGWPRLLRNVLMPPRDDADAVPDLNRPTALHRTWTAL